MALAERMAGCGARIEAALDRLLDPAGAAAPPLVAAMRHAALGGGKRLRPLLVECAAALGDADPAAVLRVGTAVELVHCYSLVHDDLPAMDDAALRRGRPTCHRAFGEATAILAGDALLTLAFEVLARPDWPAPPELRAQLVLELAQAAGMAGMCAGQELDLSAAAGPASEAAIGRLQALKTGALIRFACTAGGRLGGLGPPQLQAVEGYAERLGRAFQIKDDLLDATASSAVTGKDSRADAAAGKATFVALLGIAGAEERLGALAREAEALLAGFGGAALPLRELFEFVITRRS
jgi:farnesyl diphosphate synthase